MKLPKVRSAAPLTRAWLYDKGNATGGGTGTAGAAPPVTIISDPSDPNGPKIIERSDRTVEVDLSYTTDPSATSANFTGVEAYVEDPDISTQPRAPLDGTRALGSTSAPTAQVSGRQTPLLYNDFPITPPVAGSEIGSVMIVVADEPAERNIRVYLPSYGPNSNAVLVPANLHGEVISPNIVLTIPAASPQYVSGQEFAWLIQNPRVTVIPDYNNPTPTYSLQFFYDLPAEMETDPPAPLPAGLNPFGGVRVYYAYLNASNQPTFPATDSGINVPIAQAQGGVKSGAYNVGGGSKFWVYFASEDNATPLGSHVNTIVVGLTPYVEVDIVWPPTGGDTSLDVLNLTLSNPRMAWQPDGSLWAEADLSWTNPASNRYGGVSFYETAVNGLQIAPPVEYGGPQGSAITHLTLQVTNYPSTPQDWTITAITVDSTGKQNDDPNNPQHSPSVIWHIGPPGPGGTGQEHAPLVNIAGVTIATDQQVSSDGVQMMRFNIAGWSDPTSNQFGGVKIAMQDNVGTTYWDAGKATSLTTPWQPAVSAQTLTFDWLSYDPQNNINSILPGVTPSKTVNFSPNPGQIIASQIPNNWWNTTEFAWPTWPQPNGFQANVIAAGKIAVGSVLRVGGAPTGSPFAPSFQGQNGQIAVYSSGSDPGDNGTPTLRAWMGQQTTALPGGGSGTVYGGWFGELYVGGHGPPTSPLYVQNGGIVKLGGWDVQTALGTTYYPYISVCDRTGIEKGRIGAHIAVGPSGALVPPGDLADIGGAWFTQFALGGQNLADWRLLCPGDNSIRLRNINRFEIDYYVNTPPYPPYNQAYQLMLGTDEAYVVSMSSYKFPGISLMRATQNPDLSLTPTTHGIRILNRGIVLGSDSQPVLGAFVSFNGDGTGGDADPFWCSLTMYSNVTHQINVHLDSGAQGSGASSFSLWDGANVENFGVDQSGNVFMRGTLNWGNYQSPTQLINAAGAWVGPFSPASLSAGALTIKDNGYLAAGDGSVSSPPFGAVVNWQGFASFRGVAVGPSAPGTTVIDATGHVFAFGGALVTVNASTGTLFRVQNPSGGIMFQVDGNGNAGTQGSIAAAGFQTAGQTGQSGIFLLLGTDGHTYYQCTFTNGILTAL
jgi:hypothetical protein